MTANTKTRPFDVCVNPIGEIIYYDAQGENFTDEDHMSEVLLPKDVKAVKAVHRLQARLNDAMHRVYAIRPPKQRVWNIILVVEFCAFRDQWDVWVEIGRFAERMGRSWKVKVMHEEPHLDRWKNGDSEDWNEGPDHGRMEVQVEVRRDYELTDEYDVEHFVIGEAGKIKTEGKKLFEKYGVDVI